MRHRSSRVATLAGSIALFALCGCSVLHLPSLGKNTASGSEAGSTPTQAALDAEALKATLARAKADLIALQADTTLAPLVPAELKDAEEAVKAADTSQYDSVSGMQQIQIADHKVQLARARAETKQLTAKLEALRAQKAQLTESLSPR